MSTIRWMMREPAAVIIAATTRAIWPPVVRKSGSMSDGCMSQRKNAATGATRKVSDRKTPGGSFAFVVYPAEYRSTGAMTYLVNQDDVVYEKDLGPDTVQVAKGMTKYNPDSTWHAAD